MWNYVKSGVEETYVGVRDTVYDAKETVVDYTRGWFTSEVKVTNNPLRANVQEANSTRLLFNTRSCMDVIKQISLEERINYDKYVRICDFNYVLLYGDARIADRIGSNLVENGIRQRKELNGFFAKPFGDASIVAISTMRQVDGKVYRCAYDEYIKAVDHINIVQEVKDCRGWQTDFPEVFNVRSDISEDIVNVEESQITKSECSHHCSRVPEVYVDFCLKICNAGYFAHGEYTSLSISRFEYGGIVNDEHTYVKYNSYDYPYVTINNFGSYLNKDLGNYITVTVFRKGVSSVSDFVKPWPLHLHNKLVHEDILLYPVSLGEHKLVSAKPIICKLNDKLDFTGEVVQEVNRFKLKFRDQTRECYDGSLIGFKISQKVDKFTLFSEFRYDQPQMIIYYVLFTVISMFVLFNCFTGRIAAGPTVAAGVVITMLLVLAQIVLDSMGYLATLRILGAGLRLYTYSIILLAPFGVFTIYLITIEGLTVCIYFFFAQEYLFILVAYFVVSLLTLFQNSHYVSIPMPNIYYRVFELPIFNYFQKPWRVSGTWNMTEVHRLVKEAGLSHKDLQNLQAIINSPVSHDEQLRAAFYFKMLQAATSGSNYVTQVNYDPNTAITNIAEFSKRVESGDSTKLESTVVEYNFRLPQALHQSSLPDMSKNVFSVVYPGVKQYATQLQKGLVMINRHMFTEGKPSTEEGFEAAHAKLNLDAIEFYSINMNTKSEVKLTTKVTGVSEYVKGAELWYFKVTGLPDPVPLPVFDVELRDWHEVYLYAPQLNTEQAWQHGAIIADNRIVTNTRAGFCGAPFLIYFDNIWQLLGIHNSSSIHYVSALNPKTGKPLDTEKTTDTVGASMNMLPVHNPYVFAAGLILANRITPRDYDPVQLSSLAKQYNHMLGYGIIDVERFGSMMAKATSITYDQALRYLAGIFHLQDDEIRNFGNFKVLGSKLIDYCKFSTLNNLVWDMKVSKLESSSDKNYYVKSRVSILVEVLCFIICVTFASLDIEFILLHVILILPALYVRIKLSSFRQQIDGAFKTFFMAFILNIFTNHYCNVSLFLSALRSDNIFYEIFSLIVGLDFKDVVLMFVGFFVYLSSCLVNFWRNDHKLVTIIMGIIYFFSSETSYFVMFYFITLGPFELLSNFWLYRFSNARNITASYIYFIYLYGTLFKLIYLIFAGRVFLFGKYRVLTDPSGKPLTRWELLTSCKYRDITLEASAETEHFVHCLLGQLNLISTMYLGKMDSNLLRRAQLIYNTGSIEEQLGIIFEYVDHFRNNITSFAAVMDGEAELIPFVQEILKNHLEVSETNEFYNRHVADFYVADLLRRLKDKTDIKQILLGVGEYTRIHNDLSKLVQENVDALIDLRAHLLASNLDKTAVGPICNYLKAKITHHLELRDAIKRGKVDDMNGVRKEAAELLIYNLLKRFSGTLSDRMLESMEYLPALVAGQYFTTRLVDGLYDHVFTDPKTVEQMDEPVRTIVKIMLLLQVVINRSMNMTLESDVGKKAELATQIDQLNFHIAELDQQIDLKGQDLKDRNRNINDLKAKLAAVRTEYNKIVSREMMEQAQLRQQQLKNARQVEQEEIERRKKIEEQQQMDIFVTRLIKYMSALSKLKGKSITTVLQQFDAMVEGGGTAELWGTLFDTANIALNPADLLAYRRDDLIKVDIDKDVYNKVSFWKYNNDDQLSVIVGGGSKHKDFPPFYYVVAFNDCDKPDEIYNSLKNKLAGTVVLTRNIFFVPESVEIKDDDLKAAFTLYPEVVVRMPCNEVIACGDNHAGTRHSPITPSCRRYIQSAMQIHAENCVECLKQFLGTITYRCGTKDRNCTLIAYYAHMLTCRRCKTCNLEGCTGSRPCVENVCTGIGYHGDSHTNCTDVNCKFDHVPIATLEAFLSKRSTKYVKGNVEKEGEDWVIYLSNFVAGYISKKAHLYKKELDPQQFKLNIPVGYKIYLDEKYTDSDNFSRIFMLLYRVFNVTRVMECRTCCVSVESIENHIYNDRARNHQVVVNDQLVHNFAELVKVLPESLALLDNSYNDNPNNFMILPSHMCLFRDNDNHKKNCPLCTSSNGLQIPTCIDPTRAALYFALLPMAKDKFMCNRCKGYKFMDKCVFCRFQNNNTN